MSDWKSGHFERERVSSVIRAFAPARATDCLESIDLQGLYNQGKRLILLDVDNTLVEWKQENFSESVVAWLEEAKRLGFDLCIISNTRRLQRLARISERLGVHTVRGRFKPSRVMYRLALIKFGHKREETVMIGDQMMTDIFGANRAGIDAIWVRKIAHKEFGPTKINRMMEALLASMIYKALILPEDVGEDQMSPETHQSVKLTQQIFRFLIVGGSSFLIDAGLTALFMKLEGPTLGQWLVSSAHWAFWWANSPDKAAAPIIGGIASLFAMYNSYVWNRAWTFEAMGTSRRSTQITRFFIVSILGSGLNAVIFSSIYNAMSGQRVLLPKAIAALIVAVWNFIGQRQFAFKSRQA
jgi:HAD superfamily phosphatase (TIGR01668 family)